MKERMYHLGLAGDEGARYALLPGDPGRVPLIAAQLENAREIAFSREFRTFAGRLDGARVLVTSTGIGGPSAAIALEELSSLGVTHFIRVGTCGGMQMGVHAGDLIVPTAAVRMEGTSREYLPVAFPAAAQFDITQALVQAARAQGGRVHVGVVQSKDSFYGQHEPARMPVSAELQQNWQAWIKGGALASEMECAALFTVGACLGVRVGAVLTAVWNQERHKAGLPDAETHDSQGAIHAAVAALRLLIKETNETK